MTLLVLGINHTTAPVVVREQVAFAPETIVSALQDICQLDQIESSVILSTCNRVELLLSVTAVSQDEGALAVSNIPALQSALLHWLAMHHQLSPDELERCLYWYQHEQALHHMMMVACGLDSMVLGEPQVLGQIKSAYAVAQKANTVKGELNQALQQVFAIAKKVRTNTAIGANPVSVAFAAVHLSQHIFSSLKGTRALLIGAGETIELVARHLQEQGVKDMVVANRTLARAESVAAGFKAQAIVLSDIPEVLPEVDIVISSTASQLPILGKGMVERALKKRRHRPLFMVDIAVPRDIEAEVAELADVYLYTVDDLKGIVDENRKGRETEALKAEEIIQAAVRDYGRTLRSMSALETLKSYRQQSEALRDAELEKALQQLSTGVRPEEVLSALARNLTNKMIHTPCIQMKEAAADGETEVIAWTQKLLGITMPQPDDNE